MDIFLVFQHPLHWLIVNLTNLTQSYGLAIILFTLIIRTLLAPLYVVQMRSSRKMMQLSPQIKELQKKYGKDREALTRETMALYRQYNHNPALGCLLPLIQLPILWSLFLVLRGLADAPAKLAAQGLLHPNLYSAHFLWLQLGKPDSLHVLPIVAGITQWIQQRMMLQPTSDPQQRQMNQMMQFLPIMIVVFAWAYPSGLAVYWVTSNIFMMVMQYFIGGWGCLFTSPMTIPYASTNGATVAVQRAPAEPGGSIGGFLARAFAPPSKDAPRVKPVQTKAVKAEPTPENGGDGGGVGGKMERYAVRHNRGASRGRPSAKGAKK